LDRGYVNPGCRARDGRLEVLCQAAVSIEPGKGPFDNPAARQELKAGGRRGAFDDLDGPAAEFVQGGAQVGAIIDAVGKEMAQPGKQLVDGADDQLGPVPILDVGRVNRDTDQQAGGVGDVALR
jgi:hypothetical protein